MRKINPGPLLFATVFLFIGMALHAQFPVPICWITPLSAKFTFTGSSSSKVYDCGDVGPFCVNPRPECSKNHAPPLFVLQNSPLDATCPSPPDPNNPPDPHICGQDLLRIYPAQNTAQGANSLQGLVAVRVDAIGNVHLSRVLSISGTGNDIYNVFPGIDQYMLGIASDESTDDPVIALKANSYQNLNHPFPRSDQPLILGISADILGVPGTPTSVLTGNGSLGLGTINPVHRLHVVGDVQAVGNIWVGTKGGKNGCIETFDAVPIVGTCVSDMRLKKNIQPFPPVLDRLVRLQPVSYNWRTEEFPAYHFGSSRASGLVAQDVEMVFPEMVAVDERGYKTVNYTELPYLMLQAIRDLKAENNDLRQQLKGQEERLRRLEAAR